MKKDNISQLGDYDAPFCEQQYTHGSYYISLFKLESFDQLIPPKLPQILDIYSVVALQYPSVVAQGNEMQYPLFLLIFKLFTSYFKTA